MKQLIDDQLDVPDYQDAEFARKIEEELQRVLASDLFSSTRRLKRFLTYIVHETLAGRRELIKGYGIGVDVFDRPPDHDPQLDTIVRVQAGQLRRRLDLYYSNEGQDNKVRISMPRGHYRPVFENRQNRAKVVILPKSESATSSASPSPTKAPVNTVLLRPSIGVMPFVDLGGVGATEVNEYFSKGLTSEIMRSLQQFRLLKIVAANLNTTEELGAQLEYGRSLNLQFILTGQVRRQGELLRINVNLISTDTGEQVYAETYDRNWTPADIFSVQEEIASHVAAKLASPYGAVNRYGRQEYIDNEIDMSAYQSILKFQAFQLMPSWTAICELEKEFESIIENFPNFSSGWAILSIIISRKTFQTLGDNVDIPKSIADAEIYARHAVGLDDENALAFKALSMTEFHLGKIGHYKSSSKKALELNPNDPDSLALLGVYESHLGNFKEAFRHFEQAVAMVGKPPMWYHVPRLLSKLHDECYAEIYERFTLVTADSPPWVFPFFFALRGHLGLGRSGVVDEILTSRPNILEELCKRMAYWHYSPTLHKRIFEGWEKLGLEFEAPS